MQSKVQIHNHIKTTLDIVLFYQKKVKTFIKKIDIFIQDWLFSYEASIEFTLQISCTEHIFGDHMFVITSFIAFLFGQNWEIDYSQFITHRFIFPRLTPTNCCSYCSSIIDSFCKLYSILYEFSRPAFLVLEYTIFF